MGKNKKKIHITSSQKGGGEKGLNEWGVWEGSNQIAIDIFR